MDKLRCLGIFVSGMWVMLMLELFILNCVTLHSLNSTSVHCCYTTVTVRNSTYTQTNTVYGDCTDIADLNPKANRDWSQQIHSLCIANLCMLPVLALSSLIAALAEKKIKTRSFIVWWASFLIWGASNSAFWVKSEKCAKLLPEQANHAKWIGKIAAISLICVFSFLILLIIVGNCFKACLKKRDESYGWEPGRYTQNPGETEPLNDSNEQPGNNTVQAAGSFRL